MAGAGSTWTNTGDLSVGNDGTGTLTVEAGGSVSNGLGYVGSQSGSTGTVTVTGLGSTWTNTSQLNVGRKGGGDLAIQAGGSVSNTDGFIGTSTTGSGQVLVTGAGSDLDQRRRSLRRLFRHRHADHRRRRQRQQY